MDAIVRLMLGRLLDHSIKCSQILFGIKKISSTFLIRMLKTGALLAITVLGIFKKYPGALYFDVDISMLLVPSVLNCLQPFLHIARENLMYELIMLIHLCLLRSFPMYKSTLAYGVHDWHVIMGD